MNGCLPPRHPPAACLSRFKTRFDLCSCFGLHGLAQNETGQRFARRVAKRVRQEFHVPDRLHRLRIGFNDSDRF